MGMIRSLVKPERNSDPNVRRYYAGPEKVDMQKLNLDQEEEWGLMRWNHRTYTLLGRYTTYVHSSGVVANAVKYVTVFSSTTACAHDHSRPCSIVRNHKYRK